MSTPLAANTLDAAALADELARYRVVPPDRLTGLLAQFPGGPAAALAEFLVGRGELTAFQAERALAGEARLLAAGPYRITGVHGPGTLGQVFRAERPGRGPGLFAVRLLPLRSLWQARQAKQFVRTLAGVPAHPSLVPLIDADSASGFHYLVWPLTEGQVLAERVRTTGLLTPSQAAGLLEQLAGALALCHARGVVHGLLTPAAVAVGEDGLPRLLDLGAGTLLAQNLAADESLLDTLSSAVAAARLLDFAAPELMTDPTRPTPAADQYALGAVGYFALTGLAPAREEELPPVRSLNPEVPEGLGVVIDRMLRRDPAGRFTGLDEARERLAESRGEPLPLPMAVEEEHEPAGQPPASRLVVSNSGRHPPPERDETEASVRFDLPDSEAEPEPDEEPARAPRGSLLDAVDTPRDSALKTYRPPAPRPYPVPTAGASPHTPPARTDGPTMSKPLLTSPFDTGDSPALPPRRPSAADPRLTMPTPVQWHTSEPELPSQPEPDPQDSGTGGPRSGESSVLWKKVKRNLLFWQSPTDLIQVSVFGPPQVTPGQTVRVTVFLHHPDAAASVRTQARAFQLDAELIATGHLACEVVRGSELAVHLGATNAGVSRSLVSFAWKGQPHRIAFDLHVPWESPAGPAPGLVSVGQDNVRVGKIEFRLRVLPRRG